MTVVLTPPNPSDTRSSLADWMELLTLGSSRGRATKAALTAVLDIAEDEAAASPSVDDETGDILDEAILEGERNQIVSATFEELEYRAAKLGSAYPFSVDGSRLILERIDDNPVTQPGHVVYLFCLLASAIRETKLQPRTDVEGAERSIADAFQICACLAAGGYVSGEVTSFGFPRSTGNGFLPALRQAYERFGIGQVRAKIPDGLPESLKDGGIDVIAWRDHPDGMPGKIYLLGQCASGKNWRSKSVVEYICQLHGSWFTEVPATYSLPAMFIPFTFHRDLDEDRSGPFLTAVRNRYWHDEKRFGIIFDRIRITHFAHTCMTADNDVRNRIDGSERFEQVRTWVANALRLAGFESAAA
jgi:hypothetical protein